MSLTSFLEADLAPGKFIPVNPKTLGDHVLLKRIEANLSRPEVAIKAGVSIRTLRNGNTVTLALPKIIEGYW